MNQDVEETRARWLQMHSANHHVVAFLKAGAEKQNSVPSLNEQYRLIYTFYLAHGFIPAHAWLCLLRILAERN
jgi:hypothetical protein